MKYKLFFLIIVIFCSDVFGSITVPAGTCLLEGMFLFESDGYFSPTVYFRINQGPSLRSMSGGRVEFKLNNISQALLDKLVSIAKKMDKEYKYFPVYGVVTLKTEEATSYRCDAKFIKFHGFLGKGDEAKQYTTEKGKLVSEIKHVKVKPVVIPQGERNLEGRFVFYTNDDGSRHQFRFVINGDLDPDVQRSDEAEIILTNLSHDFIKKLKEKGVANKDVVINGVATFNVIKRVLSNDVLLDTEVKFIGLDRFLKEDTIPKHYENDPNGDLIAVEPKQSRLLYKEVQTYDLWENDKDGRLKKQK